MDFNNLPISGEYAKLYFKENAADLRQKAEVSSEAAAYPFNAANQELQAEIKTVGNPFELLDSKYVKDLYSQQIQSDRKKGCNEVFLPRKTYNTDELNNLIYGDLYQRTNQCPTDITYNTRLGSTEVKYRADDNLKIAVKNIGVLTEGVGNTVGDYFSDVVCKNLAEQGQKISDAWSNSDIGALARGDFKTFWEIEKNSSLGELVKGNFKEAWGKFWQENQNLGNAIGLGAVQDGWKKTGDLIEYAADDGNDKNLTLAERGAAVVKRGCNIVGDVYTPVGVATIAAAGPALEAANGGIVAGTDALASTVASSSPTLAATIAAAPETIAVTAKGLFATGMVAGGIEIFGGQTKEEVEQGANILIESSMGYAAANSLGKAYDLKVTTTDMVARDSNPFAANGSSNAQTTLKAKIESDPNLKDVAQSIKGKDITPEMVDGLKKSVARVYHPDMPNGNTTVMQDYNNLFDAILKQKNSGFAAPKSSTTSASNPVSKSQPSHNTQTTQPNTTATGTTIVGKTSVEKPVTTTITETKAPVVNGQTVVNPFVKHAEIKPAEPKAEVKTEVKPVKITELKAETPYAEAAGADSAAALKGSKPTEIKPAETLEYIDNICKEKGDSSGKVYYSKLLEKVARQKHIQIQIGKYLDKLLKDIPKDKIGDGSQLVPEADYILPDGTLIARSRTGKEKLLIDKKTGWGKTDFSTDQDMIFWIQDTNGIQHMLPCLNKQNRAKAKQICDYLATQQSIPRSEINNAQQQKLTELNAIKENKILLSLKNYAQKIYNGNLSPDEYSVLEKFITNNATPEIIEKRLNVLTDSNNYFISDLLIEVPNINGSYILDNIDAFKKCFSKKNIMMLGPDNRTLIEKVPVETILKKLLPIADNIELFKKGALDLIYNAENHTIAFGDEIVKVDTLFLINLLTGIQDSRGYEVFDKIAESLVEKNHRVKGKLYYTQIAEGILTQKPELLKVIDKEGVLPSEIELRTIIPDENAFSSVKNTVLHFREKYNCK